MNNQGLAVTSAPARSPLNLMEGTLRHTQRGFASSSAWSALLFLSPFGPLPTPEAYPYPPWVLALIDLWPLQILGLFVVALWMSDTLSDRWRFTAPGLFRDEGCDETREARGWQKERMITIVLLILGTNILFGIFLYIGSR